MATIGWVTDKYPHYRLSKEVVQSFLKGKFGDNGKYRESDFEVRFVADDCVFKVPRSLTQTERDELKAKRRRDDDDE